jgi:pimeloyl-ACP methyl ester carboxylesterase
MMRARTCRRSEQMTEQRRPARAVLAWVAATVTVAICLLTATAAAAQPSVFSAASGAALGKRPGDWSSLTRSTVRQQAGARPAPALAAPAGARPTAWAPADLVPCEDDPPFLCTTVPVPLDRRRPDGRTVDIHVEVFPHTGPRAEADGAVFVTCGGPGCSITSGPKYGFAFFALAETAQTRDLVFVDQRGVGLSDVIDCPAVQFGNPLSLYEDVAACHDQFGADSDLYSTTDVADDLEDVRRALGYGRIDLFGGSYAGADMMTYAVRHGVQVRSVTLASPAVVVGVDPFYAYAPEAMTQIAAKTCGRSPGCAAAHPNPARDFVDAVRELRRHPIGGSGTDSAGRQHQPTITENLLANWICTSTARTSLGRARSSRRWPPTAAATMCR